MQFDSGNQIVGCRAGAEHTKGMLGTLFRLSCQDEFGRDDFRRHGVVSWKHASVQICKKTGSRVAGNICRLICYSNQSRCAP